MKKAVTILILYLFSGCSFYLGGLYPVSGVTRSSDRAYIIDQPGPVRIEIAHVGVGTQLGRIYAVIRNSSSEPIEIDHSKTVIVTDLGEQVSPLLPEQAADAISTSVMSETILGSRRAESSMISSKGEVSRGGIGKTIIQPGAFVKGSLFFLPPKEKMETITFRLVGIPGSPEFTFGVRPSWK